MLKMSTADIHISTPDEAGEPFSVTICQGELSSFDMETLEQVDKTDLQYGFFYDAPCEPVMTLEDGLLLATWKIEGRQLPYYMGLLINQFVN